MGPVRDLAFDHLVGGLDGADMRDNRWRLALGFLFMMWLLMTVMTQGWVQ